LLLSCGAGEAHSLKVEKFLFEGKSEYQDVVVFEVSLQFTYLSCLRIMRWDPQIHNALHARI